MEEKIRLLTRVLDNSPYQEIKVACISFGYKNGDLIRLLEKRGENLG
jgi:hypothetical protein